MLPVEVSLLSTSNSRAFDLQKSFFHASIRCASSPFDPKAGATASSNASPKTHTPSAAKKKLRKFVPRKAAVELTDKSRGFFRRLLENPPRPEIVGVLLNYDQSSSGEPRMVFSFQFVTQDDVGDAEGVSLEVDADGKPKPPAESWDDGLPKLYVHPNAFLKVLGATVDVDTDKAEPILYDREGNKMDPND